MILKRLAIVAIAALVLGGCTNGASEHQSTTVTSTTARQSNGLKLSDFSDPLIAEGFVKVDEWQRPVTDASSDTFFQQWESTNGRYLSLAEGAKKSARIQEIGQIPVGEWAVVICNPGRGIETDSSRLVDRFDEVMTAIMGGGVSAKRSNNGWYAFSPEGGNRGLDCFGLKVVGQK